MRLFWIYLLIVNAALFIEMGYDKSQARRGGRRTPERRLFGFAALGGALGGILGMRVFRHKTKHASFVYGFPALLAVNAFSVMVLSRWLLG